MQNSSSRAGWSVQQYEDTVKSLLIHQKTLVSQDEENQQTIFELKKKLNLKDAMEEEYAGEITELSNTIEKLQAEVKEKQTRLTALQRSLDLVHQEMEDLKEAEVPIIPPEPDRPVVHPQMDELPKGPEVSWEEWNDLKDKVQSLETAIDESKLNVQQLQAANELLKEDVANWEIKASHLSFACENAKESYAETFSLLEDYKVQLNTAHEELALLSEQPMLPGTRGNSLFSEVEDNRKEIARRFTELKSKYMTLTVQYRRNAFNPCTFAAERAGLQSLVAEVQAIHEERDELEIESLRSRIRVQDEIIRHLNVHQNAPIKVMNVVGVAEMSYIEGIVSDCKMRERQLEIKLNEISMAHLLTQEELMTCKANLAKANAKLVQELARNRILYIDRAIAQANEAEPESGETFRAVPGPEPLNAPGPWSKVHFLAPPLCAAAGIEKPAVKESTGPEAGPSRAAPGANPVVVAPAGPVEDLNYDEARHTPPLCLPAPTIRGSQRHPTFVAAAFPARGSSKRRASAEAPLFSEDLSTATLGADPRRRHLSGPAGLCSHVRHLGAELDGAETEEGPAKPKAVNFVDEPKLVEARVPIEMGEVANVTAQNPKYASVHIPNVKRQKIGNACDRK